MKEIRTSILLIIAGFLFYASNAQTSNKNAWNRMLLEGELRIWNGNDVRSFIRITPELNRDIKKVSITAFDSIAFFEDSLLLGLYKISFVREIRLNRFIYQRIANTQLINKVLLMRLDSLIKLEIIGSHFRFLENDIVERMESLRVLTLWNNDITDVASILGQFTKVSTLRAIDFYDNPIESIPENSSIYGSLERIELGFTNVENIPCEVIVGSHLSAFGLSSTNVKKLPECLWTIERCITFGLTKDIEKKNKKLLEKLKKNCYRRKG